MQNAKCESERPEAKGEAAWEGWSVKGMSLLPHLSHAQMFGEAKGRIGGLGPEQEQEEGQKDYL